MKRYAVVGDLHGRILLAFWLVRRWQEEHQTTIDGILCVGDVGVFRGMEHMDKASRRYAEKFPEELGFAKYFWRTALGRRGRTRLVPHPRAEELLKDVSCSLYFVPGNHEDHLFLKDTWRNFARDLSSPVAIDVDWIGIAEGVYMDGDFTGFGRIRCLPQGPVVTLGDFYDEATLEPKHDLSLRAVNGVDGFTDDEAYRSPLAGSVDVLVTHETFLGRLRGCDTTGRRDEYGSERLAEFVQRLAPSWHFFGHHHWYYPEVRLQAHDGTSVHSVGLNQLILEDHVSPISMGAFGILTAEGETERAFEFSIVEDDWYANLRYREVAMVL